MPELPEVETMVRDLLPRVTGAVISDAEAEFPGIVRYPTFDELAARARGRRIEGVSRRGKYAAFHLDSGDLLIVHRGMSGSLLLRPSDAPMEAHVRFTLHLDGDRSLRFNDPRKFGRIYIMEPAGTEHPLPWERMGPEPLDGSFDLDAFAAVLRRRTALIKPLLLNQGIVAGLGNIYVDEALFLAGIHPRRRANTLTRVEVERLHRAIRDVLGAAVEGRGTTFSSYMDIEGRAGAFQRSLQVFHRTDEPCARCGMPIERLVVGGRGTHICPVCQRL